jgi:hypothetical protein
VKVHKTAHERAQHNVYFGYSTTQMFYGQHPGFTIRRWQGVFADHDLGKCKEFLGGVLAMPVPVRECPPALFAGGFGIPVRTPIFADVRAVGDTMAIRLGGAA